jgi:hypothetical protein
MFRKAREEQDVNRRSEELEHGEGMSEEWRKMEEMVREDSESGRSSTARDRDGSERLYQKTREAWVREETEWRSEEDHGGNRYGRDQKGRRWFGG